MVAGGHTSGDAVAGVTVAFTIVAVICTMLRLYTRFVLNKMAGIDDVFIAVATVCSLPQRSPLVLTRSLAVGSGTHDDHVRSRFVRYTPDETQQMRWILTCGSQVRHGNPSIITHST
jgi:hypothetical protein